MSPENDALHVAEDDERRRVPVAGLLRLFADLALLGVFLVAGLLALDFPQAAGLIPLCVAGIGSALAIWNLAVDGMQLANEWVGGERIGAGRNDPERVGAEIDTAGMVGPVRVLRCVAWIIGYALAIAILGITLGSATFVFAFLVIDNGLRWRTAVMLTATAVLLLLAAISVLEINAPSSMLPLG